MTTYEKKNLQFTNVNILKLLPISINERLANISSDNEFFMIRNLNTKKLYATVDMKTQDCRSPERTLSNVAGRENRTLYGSTLHMTGTCPRILLGYFSISSIKTLQRKHNLHKVLIGSTLRSATVVPKIYRQSSPHITK